MSQVNFEALVSKNPESERTLRLLEAWLNKHQGEKIYLEELVREVPVDSVELVDALALLVKERILRQVYKVISPDGVYADRDFNSISEIPDKLPDRFEHYFDTAESDVVPVFQVA